MRLFRELDTSPDSALVQILAEADDLDDRLQVAPRDGGRREPHSGLELTFLGGLGCRLGMLAGGAGGFLVRIAGSTLLVDPGPGALHRLAVLQRRGLTSFAELDAILCTHLHPDHIGDLLPCIEGMLAGGLHRPRAVVANATVVERYRTLSPYHFEDVATHAIAPAGGAAGHPPGVALGSLTIRATPTRHVEEAGREHTGIGFLIAGGAESVWYSGDTTLFPELLDDLEQQRRPASVAVANADASDVARRPGKAERCHLLTRDIPALCRALEPRTFVIQHYDEAYSGLRYRAAQATFAQRSVDREYLDTTVLFAGDGLRLRFERGLLVEADGCLGVEDGARAAAYAAWRAGQRPRGRQEK
jgi:ribonuclease BN (tRNA processing enzyme)